MLDATDPVVDPGETAASMTDRVAAIALQERGFLWWWIAFVPALVLLGLGVAAVAWLFARGLAVFGNNWPVMWGFPIIGYVWWIGIASGGTFISAMFFLMRVEWRASLNRIAETMTLFCAACAGLYPILHLGRPWLFYWLLPYPNTMGLWPQFKSPLVWDFVCIVAYVDVLGAVLVPGDCCRTWLRCGIGRVRGGRSKCSMACSRWGSVAEAWEWRQFRAAVRASLAALMAPLVCSVHSVVGLDFAGGATVGWHSTEYPPFFVAGAVLSGFAAVLLLVLPLRPLLRLEPYITGRHVDVLCRLLLTSSLCVAYCYVMDAFGAFYGGDGAEIANFMGRAAGPQAWVYWTTLGLNCGVPLLFISGWVRRFEPLVAVVAFGVVVGMLLERYGIVAGQLARQPLAASWGEFAPSFWDLALLAGTVGLFGTGFLLAVRFLPILSMFEMRELMVARRRA